MRDEEKTPAARLSRRALLRNAAVAGGAVVLGTTAIAARADASTKVPQKLVSYQDHPHGKQRCDNCAQFEPPSSCKVVEGTIKPEGWCKVYVKKRSS